MSDLVGNPKDRFSHITAHFIETKNARLPYGPLINADVIFVLLSACFKVLAKSIIHMYSEFKNSEKNSEIENHDNIRV